MPLDFRFFDLAAVDLHQPTPGIEPNDHFVEFYTDDRSVVESVRTFFSMGINDGDAAIIIATPEHREALARELGGTVDLPAARSKGLFTSLDASETLSLFMTDGRPDPEKFETVIGEAIERASAVGKNVRLFGEMVAVLWEQGNVTGAIELEALWNQLGQKFPFRLFCAYSAELLDAENLDSVGAVFHQHSHVIVPNQENV